VEGGPETSSMKKEKHSFALKKIVGYPEVGSHSCAECWENLHKKKEDGWTGV
jgi:hypothetical protein